MEKLKETELIRLARNGDPSAFEDLIERNYLLVYRISYRWCGTQEDAEDITQEVFMKLSKSTFRFREEAAFQTWLYRITINTAKDFSRKKVRNQIKETAYIEEKITVMNQSQNQRETTLGEKIQQMIEKLPGKLKETALLVFGEGLNHKEAAAVLNCAEKTVSWRVFQVKKELKRNLKRGESV